MFHYKYKILLILLTILLSRVSISQIVSIPLTISNNAGEAQSLNIGIDSAATDGIDPTFGEYLLPPFPPSTIFDARLKLPLPSDDYSLKDFRSGLAAPLPTIINYEIDFQAGNGTMINFQWNFPKGTTGKLIDKFGGLVVNESLLDNGSLIITNTAINKLDLIVSYDLTTNLDSYQTLPDGFQLYNNYPNPFNPITKITFALTEKVLTNLKIYNVLGVQVEELINNELDAGYHEVEWNGSKHTSGIYFMKVVAGKNKAIKKMVLCK